MPGPLRWWQGAIGIFHARRVILDMCLFTIIHEKGVGNWNSQFHAQIEKIIANNVGERRMGNKKIPTRTKTYHGDVHLREEIWIYVPL